MLTVDIDGIKAGFDTALPKVGWAKGTSYEFTQQERAPNKSSPSLPQFGEI